MWSYLYLQVHSGQIPELYDTIWLELIRGGLPFKRDRGLVVSVRGVNYRISVSFAQRNIFILKRNYKKISFNEINITVAVREPLSQRSLRWLSFLFFSRFLYFPLLFPFFLLLRFIDVKLLMTQLTANSFNTVGSITFVLYKSHIIIYLCYNAL